MTAFDTSADGIEGLIEQGESSQVEFKLRLPPEPIVSRVLTAFANTEGGILLIGVGPEGEIIGLSTEQADQYTKRLERITSSVFDSPVEIGWRMVRARRIVYAVVDKKPDDLPRLTTASGEAYQRRGPQEVRLARSSRLLRREMQTIASVLERSGKRRRMKVFVAMSFKNEEEPALEDYYNAIRRAAGRVETRMDVNRIDAVQGDFEISQEIMSEIDRRDLVIADLTLSPSNVYFELGYARGREKPIIQIARKGTTLEFDVRNWRTIFYRNATDLEEKLVLALTALLGT